MGGGGLRGFSSVYRVYAAAVGIGGSKHLLSLAPSAGEEWDHMVWDPDHHGVHYLPRV